MATITGDQMAEVVARIVGLEDALTGERVARESAENALQTEMRDKSDLVSALRDLRTSNPLESRGFNKLQKFEGEREKWKDWAPVFESYIGTISPDLLRMMKEVQELGDAQWNAAMIDPDSVSGSTRLHYLLVQLLAGTPLDMVLNAGAGEGAEAWRKLVAEYDSRAATRAAGSMMEVLKHQFSSDISTFEAFEKLVKAHNRRTIKELEDDVKVGVVMMNMQDAGIREHLILHSKRLTTFTEVREEVADISRTRSATGVVPMLIDPLKGKGKGKGKDDKGKKEVKLGSMTPQLNGKKYCGNFNFKGCRHQEKDCPSYGLHQCAYRVSAGSVCGSRKHGFSGHGR